MVGGGVESFSFQAQLLSCGWGCDNSYASYMYRANKEILSKLVQIIAAIGF